MPARVADYCGRFLLGLRAAGEAERARATPSFMVEKTRHRGRKPALRFDRRPPEMILREPRDAGWRWDPRRAVMVVAGRISRARPGSSRPSTAQPQGHGARALSRSTIFDGPGSALLDGRSRSRSRVLYSKREAEAGSAHVAASR